MAVDKYESSEAAKARKRRWWQENRASESMDKQQKFLDAYGSTTAAFAPLNDQERYVVSLYFGLEGDKPLTLEEIGNLMGISKQRVGQVKSEALKKMPLKDNQQFS